MNLTVLVGRLTKDPDIRYSTEGVCVARYTLAVDRPWAKEGQQDADFIQCVALGKNGEFAEKYLKKGMKICVDGRIQTGKYDKDGQTIYFTEVAVSHHEFCEKRGEGSSQERTDASAGSFIPVPDGIEEELPFN